MNDESSVPSHIKPSRIISGFHVLTLLPSHTLCIIYKITAQFIPFLHPILITSPVVASLFFVFAFFFLISQPFDYLLIIFSSFLIFLVLLLLLFTPSLPVGLLLYIYILNLPLTLETTSVSRARAILLIHTNTHISMYEIQLHAYFYYLCSPFLFDRLSCASARIFITVFPTSQLVLVRDLALLSFFFSHVNIIYIYIPICCVHLTFFYPLIVSWLTWVCCVIQSQDKSAHPFCSRLHCASHGHWFRIMVVFI